MDRSSQCKCINDPKYTAKVSEGGCSKGLAEHLKEGNTPIVKTILTFKITPITLENGGFNSKPLMQSFL